MAWQDKWTTHLLFQYFFLVQLVEKPWRAQMREIGRAVETTEVHFWAVIFI